MNFDYDKMNKNFFKNKSNVNEFKPYLGSNSKSTDASKNYFVNQNNLSFDYSNYLNSNSKSKDSSIKSKSLSPKNEKQPPRNRPMNEPKNKVKVLNKLNNSEPEFKKLLKECELKENKNKSISSNIGKLISSKSSISKENKENNDINDLIINQQNFFNKNSYLPESKRYQIYKSNQNDSGNYNSNKFNVIRRAKNKKRPNSTALNFPIRDQMEEKLKLKKMITNNQTLYKEYPRGWNSSKEYFVNNGSNNTRTNDIKTLNKINTIGPVYESLRAKFKRKK